MLKVLCVDVVILEAFDKLQGILIALVLAKTRIVYTSTSGPGGWKSSGAPAIPMTRRFRDITSTCIKTFKTTYGKPSYSSLGPYHIELLLRCTLPKSRRCKK